MLLQVLANIALPAIIQIVMAVVIIAASGDLQIAAVFVASFSLYGAIYYWATRRLVARQRKAADAAADLGATLTDGLLHPETSKYLNAEEALSERIGQQSGKTGAAWVKFYRERVRAQLLVTAVFAMTLAVTILLSLDSVRAGTLGVGGFVMITTYALQVVRPLETLGVIYRESLRGWVQLKEVLQLLSLEPERTGGAALPSGPLEIELDEVHLKYDGKEPTLLGCTLSVQAGKKVAIVGASGSGKSTIMRILAGLYSPEEGEIRIGGTSVSLIDRKLLRRRLGVVPQDTALFDGTIGWNIAVGCEGASTNDIARAAEQVGISAFINKLPEKYETPVGQRGLKLSGGERQRIGLARMALRYPGLIILDEPTSSLDTSTETEINSAIQKQFPDSTVITFSHRLYSIQNSEEILVLDQGRIQEKGTHRELLSRGGLYARMWNDQQTGNDPDAE